MHGAVAPAGCAPAVVEAGALGDGVLGGELFVDVDAQAGGLVGVQVAVLDLRAAREDGPGLGRKDVAFVNSEVVAGKLECQPGRMTDRRAVAGTVPGGLDAEEFAERGHLARHREARRSARCESG